MIERVIEYDIAVQLLRQGELEQAIPFMREGLKKFHDPFFFFRLLRGLALLGRAGEIEAMAAFPILNKTCYFPQAEESETDAQKKRSRAIVQGKPGLFLNALPKSGSLSIWWAVGAGLELPRCYISINQFPGDFMIKSWARELQAGGAIARAHMDASAANINGLLDAGVTKTAVHLRDPRQALLSWAHYTSSPQLTQDRFERRAHHIPDQFETLSLHDRLELLIGQFYPKWIAWIEGWVKAAKEPELGVFFTHYEDFLENPRGYYNSLLSQWGIANADAIAEKITSHTEKKNYRKAAKDEWKNVFSAAQMEKVNALLPESIASRFGWR